jgi:hypothetical protein
MTIFFESDSDTEPDAYSDLLCALSHDANKQKIWALADMDADHVTPWSKGGTSDISNCKLPAAL